MRLQNKSFNCQGISYDSFWVDQLIPYMYKVEKDIYESFQSCFIQINDLKFENEEKSELLYYQY